MARSDVGMTRRLSPVNFTVDPDRQVRSSPVNFTEYPRFLMPVNTTGKAGPTRRRSLASTSFGARLGEQLVQALHKSHEQYRAQGMRMIWVSGHYRNAAGNGIDFHLHADPTEDLERGLKKVEFLYREIENGVFEFDGKPREKAFAELDALAAQLQPIKDTFRPVMGAAGGYPEGLRLTSRSASWRPKISTT
ncbi:MAG: hypothetical protein ABI895_24255 [Deltaproteobacteria bacterium]